ncbi:MAG: glycosyltransferase family 4 protein [Nitrososphaerales archaeon]
MKVLQLTERYPPAVGGVETHVRRLSQELRKMGVDVRVVTTDLLTTDPVRRFKLGKGDPSAQDIPVKRVRAYRLLPVKQGLGLISPGMLACLKGVDVVHAHGYAHFPTYLARLCWAIGIPCVVTTHSDAGRLSVRKRMFDIAVPWFTIRGADKVIAVSDHERRVLVRRGVDESKIAVIPNGVDIAEFPSRENPKSDEGIKTILYAGRIDVDQKGLDVLIRAFAILFHRLPMKLLLRLVGPDWSGSTDRLRKLARTLKVDNSVEFLGYQARERFVALMQSSDVFVLPSRFEPFGIVLLEALAACVPIVASRVGAVPEILEHGKFGQLFEREDTRSLAGAMEYALTHPADVAQMAEKGRESLARYSWKNVAAATEKVYQHAKFESSRGQTQRISRQPTKLGANRQ